MSEMVPWIAADAEKISLDSTQRAQRGAEEDLRASMSRKTEILGAHNFVAPSLSEKGAQPITESGVPPSGAKAHSLSKFCGTAEAVPFPKPLSEKRLGQSEIEESRGRERPRHTDSDWEHERERRIYRGRTVAMLRRYMRYSMETGRLPSLVGREFFRSNVTKYRVTTFEDRVIFVHDVERCLGRLDEFGREVLGRVVLQEYEHEEAARMFGCTRMTVHRKLLEALDRLSEILLEVELLDDLSPVREK